MTRADLVGTTLKGTETFISSAPERTTAATRFENFQSTRTRESLKDLTIQRHRPVVLVPASVEHVTFTPKTPG